jgi:hypothetical protein
VQADRVTPLFEALVMALAKEMPVKALAGLVGEEDKRIWRIVHHYVAQAVEAEELSEIEQVGIDDTSCRRRSPSIAITSSSSSARRSTRSVERRPENLTEKQLDWLDELLLRLRATVRAYEQGLKFDDSYELEDPAVGAAHSVEAVLAWCMGVGPQSDFAWSAGFGTDA